MLSAVSVLMADHCPAWYHNPAIPKYPRLTLLAGRRDLPHAQRVPPGGGFQEPLQGAQPDILALSMGHSPRLLSFHVCIPAMLWDTHGKMPTDLPSSLLP